jgi:hypothetical protein
VEERNSTERKKIGDRGVVARGGEKKLTLVCGFVYHVMNSTCIHLRAEGPNIYLYMRGRIYKEPPGEIH